MTAPVQAGRLARLLRLDALNRVWRTVLQGLAWTALVAAAIAAQAALGDGPVDWARVGLAAASAAGMVVVTYATNTIRTGRLEPIPVNLDALVRAGRTLLVGALTTAGAAVVEVVRAALAFDSFDLGHVAWTAATAAGVAVLAYLHRAKLDPLPVPSASPPVLPASLADVRDPVAAADADARRADPPA